MLLLMEDVDVKRVTMLKKQFDEHDADGSGYLDRDDLATAMKSRSNIGRKAHKADAAAS